MTILNQLTTLCITSLHDKEKISDTGKLDFCKTGCDGDTPLLKNT